MVPPKNMQVTEFRTSTVWFDEHGILCTVAKKVPLQNKEEAIKAFDEFKEYIDGKKVCMLSDSSDAPPANKEVRDYAAELMPEIAKAVAVISRSAVGRMAANLFFSIKKQPYPVKMFNDEAEAKEWLKQYL